MGMFDNFVALNDLIQVVYHSTSCFVLISSVEPTGWTVELGLVGEGGHWWRGSWSKNDVYKLAGSKVSEKALQSFATRLENCIITGELAIGDWTAENGSEMKLQIDPSDGAPVIVPLVKFPTEEGSIRAINMLKRIALQAQSRQCRINGPAIPATNPVSSKPSEPTTSKQDKVLKRALEQVVRLQREVDQAKQATAETATASTSKSVAPRPPPGASRANPTRQKRKIVEAEFESD